MLPMIKLGGLVARTLTKPLARVVKSRSKNHPLLRAVCSRLGQQQHRMTMKLHMGFRGISSYTIKPVSPDQAVEQGADLIGELLIFSVALGVASLEYSRSAASARAKEARQKDEQQREEQETETRFEYLESQVAWLEDRVVALMCVLESERGESLEKLLLQAQEQVKRRQGEGGELDKMDEKTGTEASSISSVVTLWTSTRDAVARLLK
uniref:OPA3-like protein n=1 Tax=Peronospora matthiolae TaxID=2874970 RepID=A0AAV1U7E6_9STRA